MVTVPLGVMAYKRTYAGEPEIKLINRWLEKNPANLREKIALISRPGETSLGQFSTGRNRGAASFEGLFNSDLFIVFGTTLYRVAVGTAAVTPITGVVQDNGFVYFTWMKGAGYEYLFISDGSTLQYYNTHALGTLTTAGTGTDITDVAGGGIIIKINTTHYAWSANVDTGTPDGTSSKPYRALLGTASVTVTQDEDSLANMVKLLNFTGTPGIDFSSGVDGPSTDVSASSTATTLNVVALIDLSAGNLIATVVDSGSGASWGAATLTGGGGQVLQTSPMPSAGEVPTSITQLAGDVLVTVGGTQHFRWLEPGSLVFDPLNFASKESNPDPINSMTTIGDQVIICGAGSTENWYATGDFGAPFAPVEGRVYNRGALAGTECKVNDSLILVGNDGKVYAIGYSSGDTSQYGVHRISTNAIEERIRVQMRLLQGLAP